MRTQVAIIGSGPAGLLLGHLLRREAVDCLILERRSRDYVESRVRAGVLEQSTVDLITAAGLGDRLKELGLVHRGTNIVCDGEAFRIDFSELTGGKSVVIYGQQEVMKDLFDTAASRDVEVVFGVERIEFQGLNSSGPVVSFIDGDGEHRLDCDFVVGCDGSHGCSRHAIPAEIVQIAERHYPFGWLGILADVPPPSDELVYASHARGFALASMRSKSRSRYYLQCELDEDLSAWPDARIYDELCIRLGPSIAGNVTRGPSFEKSIAPLRSFVAEPMRYGKLFLAGDAAHVVPPTGAKGLNLAVSDVAMLSDAFVDFYRKGSPSGLDSYSDRALARVWKAERFSWWFTHITHRFPGMDTFDRGIQVAEIDYLRRSRAAQTVLAENYVGLPLDWPGMGASVA